MKLLARASKVLGAIALLQLTTGILQAEHYPSRPITLVVPLGPGAYMDTMARAVAKELSSRLGGPVIVENKAGGGTLIAAGAVAKSSPDGHTLLMAPSATLTSNATIYRELPYNPVTDFVPLALMSKLPFVLVSNPLLPIHAPQDLVAFAKQQPGKLSYASNGIGQAPHLAGEMLKSIADIEMAHVPYRGMPQATADVVAGHVHLLFADPLTALPLIRDGKLRAIGVSSSSSVPLLPDVRPLAESFPGFEVVSWQMIVAPAKTPRDVVNTLHAAVSSIIATHEFRERVAMAGSVPVEPSSIEDLRYFLNAELVRWGNLVRQAGLANSQ